MPEETKHSRPQHDPPRAGLSPVRDRQAGSQKAQCGGGLVEIEEQGGAKEALALHLRAEVAEVLNELGGREGGWQKSREGGAG